MKLIAYWFGASLIGAACYLLNPQQPQSVIATICVVSGILLIARPKL